MWAPPMISRKQSWQGCFWPLPFVHAVVLPPGLRLWSDEPWWTLITILSVSKQNGPQPPPSHIKLIMFGNELQTYDMIPKPIDHRNTEIKLHRKFVKLQYLWKEGSAWVWQSSRSTMKEIFLTKMPMSPLPWKSLEKSMMLEQYGTDSPSDFNVLLCRTQANPSLSYSFCWASDRAKFYQDWGHGLYESRRHGHSPISVPSNVNVNILRGLSCHLDSLRLKSTNEPSIFVADLTQQTELNRLPCRNRFKSVVCNCSSQIQSSSLGTVHCKRGRKITGILGGDLDEYYSFARHRDG